MPVYEVQKGGKTFEVEAPTLQAAAAALRGFQVQAQPAQPAPMKPMASHGTEERSTVDKIGDALERTAKNVEDFVIGGMGRAGIGGTLYGAAKLVSDYTPLPDLPDQPALRPRNTAESAGKAVENIAEFFTPVGVAGKAKVFAEAAKSGGLTLAQGGGAPAAAASAALSAAIPGVTAIARVSKPLRESAEKSVVQALGPTKEWAKDQAAKIAPQVLQRGVRGSRAAMLEQASAKVQDVGARINAEYHRAAQAGQTIDGVALGATLTLAKDAFVTTSSSGHRIPIPGTQHVLKQIDRLEKFVSTLGPDIPYDKAAKIKSTFDRIVAPSGLYGAKSGASATDNANAWAFREAAGAFRNLLNSGNATLADLNQEFAFWKGLQKVLTETEKRTQSHGGGLVSGVTGAAGMGAGFASGDSASDRVQNAVIGGLMGRQLVRMVQSPWWRTSVSAPLKNNLADALASGSMGKVVTAMRKIAAAVPSQIAQPVPSH